jgi:FKBP-type peptidyl-prolyl cis-trans isomerase FkpA
MTRTLLISVAALTLAACAATPQTPPPIAVGAGTAEGWAAGNAQYLVVNGARRGWTTTESGLQYRRIGRANPDGRRPVATDTVKVHYRGTFVDGREFDSSYARNEPAEFPLNRVIKGWTEGVALMREGEQFEFVIPASLGYGDRWVGGDELPPGSTLLFTVELLEVKTAAAPSS